MTAFTEPISIAISKAGISNFKGDTGGLYKSPIETPVYSDLSIAAGSYMVDGKTISYTPINLPDALFVVKKQKRIKTTGINGAASNVFEYNGSESATISCTIKIYGTNLNYPKDEVNNFYLVLKSNQPIQINSWYLNQLEIQYAVVTGYELPQQIGNISNQQVKFSMRHLNPNQYPRLLNA